ncbi:MAG: FecR domain-containing protein [Chitinophagaceae bacterium]|nr:FecR domain-containing protein [Chitinophagaceae bacterium]
MVLPKERIFYLLEAYISKRSTSAEENELMEWIRGAGEDAELKDFVLDIWNREHSVDRLSDADWDTIYARVVGGAPGGAKIRRMSVLRFAVAAAAVLVILCSGYYFYFTSTQQIPIAAIPPVTKDIAPPSGSKAVLTLADGSSIEVDSTANGTIAVQGNVSVIKLADGTITYKGNAAKGVSYNTFSVPRGSRPLGLTLSDGSQVWLNVGSSLTYPTAFAGKERRVKITGEAYFEIAHNAAMPFRVQHDDITVSVLGTHFNVNTYEDESAKHITLLQGSVLVSKKSVSKLLEPGQQASINHNETSDIILNEVNLDEVMAWRDGKFRFGESTDIGTIMRQISRWYNAEIEYKGVVNQRFVGSISKDVNVSQVLKILEATGGVKFSTEGNKIVVMPVTP